MLRYLTKQYSPTNVCPLSKKFARTWTLAFHTFGIFLNEMLQRVYWYRKRCNTTTESQGCQGLESATDSMLAQLFSVTDNHGNQRSRCVWTGLVANHKKEYRELLMAIYVTSDSTTLAVEYQSEANLTRWLSKPGRIRLTKGPKEYLDRKSKTLPKTKYCFRDQNLTTKNDDRARFEDE